MSQFHPIVYVRGYAMTASEIADTVSMPYMGFNLGATKVRQSWDGTIYKQVFESPMMRLMKDYGYTDAFSDGAEIDRDITHKTVIIYRYYDQADRDFGEGKPLSIPAAALQLRDLILNIRKQICGDDATRLAEFRVHLVAHSMGGLVCRCLLQNDGISSPAVREMVDKVFTYATPHNGIEMAGINVPAFLGLWDINNFNRETMAGYLNLDGRPERVDSLGGKFDPNRFFCLVGTNQQDYGAAKGVSKWLAGKMSDGLDSARSPVLFSTFLDSSKITVDRGRTLVMTVELAVSATDYFVDGALWTEHRVEGEYLYRDTLTLKMTPVGDGWNLRYVTTDEQWSERGGSKAEPDGDSYLIPLSSKKGFKAQLRMTLQRRT